MTVTKKTKIVNKIVAFLTKSQTFLPFLLPLASSSEPIINAYENTEGYYVLTWCFDFLKAEFISST
jgi:hypothetical protein